VTSIELDTPTQIIGSSANLAPFTFTNAGAVVNLADDDFLVDYTINTVDNISVIATAADLSAVSADANVSAFGGVLTGAFAAGALDAGIANTLNGVADAAAFETASLSLLPSINEGVTREVYESHSLADNFVERRLRSDAARGAWIQGFGRTADRDADSTSVSGYDASSFGVSVGADANVSEVLVVGAAFNYASISIDSEGPAAEETDLDSFQVSAYAGYTSGAAFLNGQVGYVFSDGEAQRNSVSGIVNSDFDVNGFTAQVTAGYSIENGTWVVTPLAGLRFADLSQDDFVETGGLNLSVDAEGVQYLDARVGADLTGSYESGFKPFVRAAYVYDIIGDERVLNIGLPGGAPFVLSTTEPAQSRFEINTGFGIDTGNGFSLNIEYDGEFASSYQSHGGFVRARFAF